MFTIGAAFFLGLFFMVHKKAHWAIGAALAILGGGCLALSWAGDLLRTLLIKVIGFVTGLFPEVVPAGAVIGAVSLFLLIIVAIDVWNDKRLDKFGMYAAIALPVLLLAAGGTVGAAGGSAANQIAAAARGLLGPLIGG